MDGRTLCILVHWLKDYLCMKRDPNRAYIHQQNKLPINSFCNRDVPHPHFKVKHVGAHEQSINMLNGGQHKIGNAHIHHVGIAKHT